jgi:hypothetical protein
MAVEYLDKGNDDGTVLGQDSSELIAFWGGTPCDQPATITKTALSATSTAGTVALSVAVDALITALQECGLIASS